jgi:hypothetical protein
LNGGRGGRFDTLSHPFTTFRKHIDHRYDTPRSQRRGTTLPYPMPNYQNLWLSFATVIRYRRARWN